MKTKHSFIITVIMLLVYSNLSPFLVSASSLTNDGEQSNLPEPIFRVENEQIGDDYYTDLNEHVDDLKGLDEGTIITKFRYTGSGIMSLFSLSNKSQANEHFHMYISPNAIGSENRNQSGSNTHVSAGNIDLPADELHTAAMVVSKDEGYKFFLNGKLMHEDKDSAVKFLNNINEPNSAQLGRTERPAGQNEYNFSGEFEFAEVYGEPLPDQDVINITGGYSEDLSTEITDIFDEKSWKRMLNYPVDQVYPSNNGVDEKVYTDISEDVDTIKEFSSGAIVAKFKTTAASGINTIFSFTDDTKGTYNTHSTLAVKNGKLFFSITDNHQSSLVTDQEIPSGTINDGEWHVVAIITNETGSSIYLDGEELLTDSSTEFLSHLSSANRANIGRSIASNTPEGHDFYKAGDIAYVDFYSEDTNAPLSDLKEIKKMTTNMSMDDDDTWVFTGGGITQGVEQVGGTRNYVGLFEEVVRWEQAGERNRLQRFMINKGKQDQTIADLNKEFNETIASYQPKAVSVMIGLDDSQAGVDGIDDFKENLSSLIDKIRDIDAIPVLQLQNAIIDEENVSMLEQYLENVRTIATDKQTILIDHYDHWKNREAESPGYIETHVNNQTYPNELGHLEMAKDLIKELIGITNGETYNLTGFDHETKDRTIPNAGVPNVSGVSDGTIKIDMSSILEEMPNISEFHYEIALDEKIKMTKEFTKKDTEVSGLDPTKEYPVYVYATLENSNETIAFTPVTIQPTDHSKGQEIPVTQTPLDSLGKVIHEKITSPESTKWMFIGDSITHGALWTFGYESFPQLFEKRLRTELGRSGDTIINTGVSGATTEEFLANDELRMNRYDADVVFIMFGMNDSTALPIKEFTNNLTAIVNDVKNNQGIPVLMTSNPAFDQSARETNLPLFMDEVRQVAKENDVLLIDHDKLWEKQMLETSYIGGASGTWMGDSIHPGFIGHLKMAQNIFESIGINNQESELSTLDYVVPAETVHANDKPSLVAVDEQSITIDPAEIAQKSDVSFRHLDIELALDNGEIYKTQVKPTDSNIIFSDLEPLSKATLHVVGFGDKENKIVEFEDVLIELQEKLDLKDLETLIQTAKGYEASDYTESTYINLQTAIADAESALETIDTAEDLQTAIDALQAAIEGLEDAEEPTEPEQPEYVDVSDLEKLIQEAEGISNDGKYTEESFATLTGAIEDAKLALETIETAEDLQTAIDALQAAIDALEEAEEPTDPEQPDPEDPKEPEKPKVPDTSKLDQLIAEAEDIIQKNEQYTKESFEDLQTAVEDAKKALETIKSDDDLQRVLASLQEALDDLKIKPSEPGSESEVETPKPTDPKDPPINQDQNSDKNTTTQGEGDKLPSTATSIYNWLLVGIFIASIGMVILTRRGGKKVV